MREMLFENKDKLFEMYEDAAKAAKDYHALKPTQSVKTVNLAPDNTRTRIADTSRKK